MRIKKTSQYIEGGAGLPSYFTTETNTGMKWIDGKDIYRKVIETTNPTVTTDGTTANKSISLGVSNTDFIYIESAIMVTSTATYTSPTMTMSGNRVWRVDGDIQSKGVIIYTNNITWSNANVKIIVRYTKSS